MGSLGLIALVFVAACTTSATTEPPVAQAREYKTVVDLFDRGIARTCALNGGVCHNSNNYPDLHTVSNLIGTVGRACNVEARTPQDINDACEPPADRLVAAGFDAAIVHATVSADLARVTLVLDPPMQLPANTATEVHRGSTIFAAGSRVASATGAEITLTLATADAKRFYDIREYPIGPLQVRVGDPNGNGIQGATSHAMPLITPGDPERSYLMMRLVDLTYGELMPRQCRTWDDRANEALACWIAGLGADAANAYDPIDYDACAIDVHGLGKCEQSQ